MKTTVDIADSLLAEAKRAAARDGTTVRALIERGLRQSLAERKGTKPFRLRKASFKGKGYQRGLADVGWERIRDLAYEDHGA